MIRSKLLVSSTLGLLIVGIGCYFFVQETSVKQSGYLLALEQSRGLNKNLLLYFTGKELCPACIVLEKSVIETPVFQNYLLNKVVFYPVDCRALLGGKLDPTIEKASAALTDQFHIEQTPTLVLVNRQGREITRLTLFPPGTKPEEIIQQLDAAGTP